MINIEDLRDNPEKFKKTTKDKQLDPEIVERALKLDQKRRELIKEIEDLRAKRNLIAKEGKASEEGKRIKEELKIKEPELEKVTEDFLTVANQIPNPAFEDVPLGEGEKDNVVLRSWGEPLKLAFTPKDHFTLGKDLGILDFETGAKVTGSQFYYLFGDGARLELALVLYAIDFLSEKGFIPVITPDLAKSKYYLGTGYLPKGKEAQTYTIEDQDLGLIATAEVTLAGIHADETIPESKLPLKFIGYSHCFRQEAGAYGKYSKGLYRVHQFTKAEMFIYCLPEESEKMHQEILKMEEEIFKGLKIPYRVVEMSTGDLGAMAARKYDLEAWMPGRGEYGEVTSTSNCTDYQARNLGVRVKRKDGKTQYAHLLNGTAVATSRTLIAILENYQQEDGSVIVPEVLRKWMGKERIIPQKAS